MKPARRAMLALGLAALIGGLLGPVNVGAQGDGGRSSTPPQVIPSGYESLDALSRDATANASANQWSAWIVESSRFMGVPFGGFMPDRATEAPIDFPVNVGILKGRDGKITLYDTGWQQQDYIYRWNNSCCFAPLRDEMRAIGLNPDDVTAIVIGHGHWDHAGQLDPFGNGVLYVQREELRAIDWALAYPDPRISAWNTMGLGATSGGPVSLDNPSARSVPGVAKNTCARSPACGYPPKTVMQIAGKIMSGMARVIDGRYELASGLIIHPAFRGHTYGAQLLQANTASGQLVFGSDTYSSWEGIRDWQVANIQQTDTVQQMLAYEKCYVLTGTPTDKQPNGCIAAHERLSYSGAYPITQYWWNITDGSGTRLNCARAAELSLANGEATHVPSSPDQSVCVSRPNPLPGVSSEGSNPAVPGY